jgi:hypothetical protein
MVLETNKNSKLVGIWKKGQCVYILRKHVGLSLLNTEEYGIEEEEDL